jgi:hypothetical protein
MNRALVAALAALMLTVMFPSAVWAEVMDKEPTLTQVWVVGAVAAVLGFLAWRRHLVLGVAASLLAAVPAWALHQELADPHVGPAILEEAGRSYVIQAYGVMLLCVALHLAGAAVGIQAQRRRGAAVV